MHPYELRCLVQERHKDEVLILKRGSLYHATDGLHQLHFIAAMKTTRAGHRLERTVYRITAAGRRELTRRLRELIALPQREIPVFTAAVSYLLYLSPEDTIAQLETRARLLEQHVTRLADVLAVMTPRIGRINLIEAEHARALLQAELAWVRALVDDVRAGRLVWDPEALLAQVRAA